MKTRHAARLAAALLACAVSRGDVISQIVANARCIEGDFLSAAVHEQPERTLARMFELYAEAHELEPELARARDSLRTVTEDMRARGFAVPPRVEMVRGSSRGSIDAATLRALDPPPPPPPPPPSPSPPPPPPLADAAAAVEPATPHLPTPDELPFADADSPEQLRVDRATALIRQGTHLQLADHGSSFSGALEAVAIYREVLALLPDLELRAPSVAASVHDNMGSALRQVDRVDEAIEQQLIAVEIMPHEPRHLLNLAGSFFMAGRNAETIAYCRRALSIDEWCAKALSIWVSVEPVVNQTDPRLAILRTHAAAPAGKLDMRDITLTHFALYKALDKFGQYEEAWEHLQLGNANALRVMATQDRIPTQQERLGQNAFLLQAFSQARVDELIASARAARATPPATGGLTAAELASIDDLDVGPIFIVGSYRSGSTLVETILNSHSHVYGAGETTALVPAMLDVVEGLRKQGVDASWPDGLLRHASAVDPSVFERIGARYMSMMRVSTPMQQSGKPRWVDKNLGNARNVATLLAALPNARVIHTQRRAEASCFSMLSQHFTSGGVHGRYFTTQQDFLAEQYVSLQEVMRHWDGFEDPRMITVHYEDLVNNQDEMSRRILAFAGLAWEDGVLEFYKRERNVATASMTQVRKPMYNSSLESWRRYEHKLGTLIEMLKVLPTDPWKTAIRPVGNLTL